MATFGSFRQGIISKTPKPTKPYKRTPGPWPAAPVGPAGANRGVPGGTRPRPPTGLPGRPKPIVTKPPVTTPPPVLPTRPDFGAWYKTDPRYLLQHPQFAAQKAGLYAQYGWQPQTDAAGNVTGYTQSSAADNPFSIVQQLSQALAGNSQHIQDSANSRGLLFSGAQVQGQQNATHDYENSLSDAQKAFQNALAGVNTNESQMISDLYPDYLATAPPGGAPKPVAAKPPVAAKKPVAAKPPVKKPVAAKKTIPKRPRPKFPGRLPPPQKPRPR